MPDLAPVDLSSSENTILKVSYKSANGDLCNLPDWADFYLKLGQFAISQTDHDDERRIIGIAIPTRAFSAAFAAVGAVIGDFGRLDDQKTDDEYFEYLCSLPQHTPIKWRGVIGKKKERLYDGILQSVQEISGQRMLKIQLEKASMSDAAASGWTQFISKGRVREILVPTSDDAVTLEELPTNQKGVRAIPVSGFTTSIFGPHLIANFESESKMTCLIVGSKSVLDVELKEHRFVTNTEAEGTLSELLRLKNFPTQGAPYRSNIFATNSRRPPQYEGDLCPALVIFDGALGFLKWRDKFPQSHWLVLLDETNPNFESGRDTLNSLYIQRSGTDPSVALFPALPDGVEMIFFQEKKR